MPLNRTGIFYGWWLVAACAVGISTSPQPFVFGSLGLFMKPLGEEFGWTRSQISACMTVFTVTSAVCFPIVGRLIDRFGAKLVLLLSMLALACCLCAMTLVTQYWHLVLVFLLIGTLAAGSNTVSYVPILSAWFDRHRGLAIGLAVAGIGLGFFYTPILAQTLIDAYGWRAGYLGLGAVIVVVAVPLIALVVRNTPVEMGLAPDGDRQQHISDAYLGVGLSGAEAVRTRVFWVLMFVFFSMSFVLNGVFAHLVPMLTDRGMPAAEAALAASALGITVFVSRIIVGFLVDRFFAPLVAVLFFTLSAIGVAMFGAGAVGATALVASLMIGLSLGAELDLMAYLASRYFGLRAFGANYGMLLAGIVCGAGLAPFVFAVRFESTGAYTEILAIAAALNVVAVITAWRLGPYPEWARPGEATRVRVEEAASPAAASSD